MTPRELAREIENAFDGHSRDMLRSPLAMLVAKATPPDFSRLTREQLELRRNDLRVQLADINDRLVAMDAAGQRTQQLQRDAWLRSQPPSLDPSDT